MAGLFDFFQPQGGSGLLGNVNGWLGNNQDALIAMGLGLAGGSTPMEGFKGGMQGYLSGRASDQSRVAGEGFLKELGLGVAPSAGPFSKPTPAMPGQMPGAAPAGMPPMGGQPQPNMPRGIRNNNPLNIESGPFTQGLPGYQGSDGRFARFESPQQGIDAASRLLDIYQNKHGLNTVQGIINRWAPAGENDTRGYAASVAGRLGVSPDQPLTPEQRMPLIMAMGQFENGRPIPTGGGPQVAGADGLPARPDARGVYGADAVMMPPQAPVQAAQDDPGALPPNARPTQFMIPGPSAPAPAGPAQPVPQDELGRIRQMPLMTVMRWAMNPNLKGPQAEVAKMLFAARLEDTKMTEKQKDYLWAQGGGFNGSRADFLNPPKLEDTGQRDQFGRPLPKAWVNSNDQSIKQPGASGGPGLSGADGSANPPIELVTDLRKNVQNLPSYRVLAEAEPVYTNMLKTASTNTKLSDVNLIFGLGKLLDPGSVVRDGDQLAVKKGASLPDFVIGAVNSLNGGSALTPATRKAIMDEAHNRISSYREAFDNSSKQFRDIATDYKIKQSHVIPNFDWFKKWEPPFPIPSPEPLINMAPKPVQGGAAQNPYEAEARRRGLIK